MQLGERRGSTSEDLDAPIEEKRQRGCSMKQNGVCGGAKQHLHELGRCAVIPSHRHHAVVENRASGANIGGQGATKRSAHGDIHTSLADCIRIYPKSVRAAAAAAERWSQLNIKKKSATQSKAPVIHYCSS